MRMRALNIEGIFRIGPKGQKWENETACVC